VAGEGATTAGLEHIGTIAARVMARAAWRRESNPDPACVHDLALAPW
jgi:hypothetical protein